MSRKERIKGKLEDLGVEGRIILECILKPNGSVLNEFIVMGTWTND
jgi:hypothetical protein